MNSMSGEKLKGIPYTGTLPATLTGTKAGYLHRYKIYGNVVQTGTPTPENPIEPSECGEKTENLCVESTIQKGYYGTNAFYNVFTADDKYRALSMPLKAGTYTIYIEATESIRLLRCSNDIDGFVYVFSDNSPYTFTLSGDTTIYVSWRNSTTTDSFTNMTVMLNEGSTALPYEPYGYKLPLSSGSTPVDIYLGESQTTRKIKKLVLTGEESGWTEYASDIYRLNISTYGSGITAYGISSHFISVDSTTGMPDDSFLTGENFMYIKNTGAGSLTGWKTYLADQLTAGTPVTVWYALATEETGTLNEPLRKIGDYADTIDSTQTNVQIPTSASSTTISWAGSGLAPSEFDSIQEWVNTPTYTYTNGAWVADN